MAKAPKIEKPRQFHIEIVQPVTVNDETPRDIWDQMAKWAPVFISLVTIIVSVGAGLLTYEYRNQIREHQERMLMPRLTKFIESAEMSHGLWVENKGLGPAEITRTRLYVDRTEMKIENDGPSVAYYNALKSLDLKKGDFNLYKLFEFQHVAKGDLLKTSEKIAIFNLSETKLKKLDSEQRKTAIELFRSQMGRINVMFCYCSLINKHYNYVIIGTAASNKRSQCPSKLF